MISIENLRKISDVLWEIPKTYRADMRVPARVFTTREMLEQILVDRSLEQLINVATLEGIQKWALAMPDIHEGYGFPIGGVAATSYPDGVISPGGIGYDINCGVRLLRSEKTIQDIEGYLGSFAKLFYETIPSGLGRGGSLDLSIDEVDDVLVQGARWMLERGYAFEDDLAHIESNGCLTNADPLQVSERAKQRGHDQLGTLGAGNHFAEVDFIEEIFDEQAAEAFGLFKHQAMILIHTGSRGLGHQVATDHIRAMMSAYESYGISLPDRELACVPFSSPEGQSYWDAMAAAANFAWANRQMLTHLARKAWAERFGKEGGVLSLVYDVAHNIAKIEEHEIDGEQKKVIVHRKGATRAFGPGNNELAQGYRAVGQPVLIPGSMGTASYVLAGNTQAMNSSFGSCCHGAGRVMSRAAAKREVHGGRLRKELMERGIYVHAGSIKGLAEEAPRAYKDIDDVVRVVDEAGIARRVARMRPCVVIKG